MNGKRALGQNSSSDGAVASTGSDLTEEPVRSSSSLPASFGCGSHCVCHGRLHGTGLAHTRIGCASVWTGGGRGVRNVRFRREWGLSGSRGHGCTAVVSPASAGGLRAFSLTGTRNRPAFEFGVNTPQRGSSGYWGFGFANNSRAVYKRFARKPMPHSNDMWANRIDYPSGISESDRCNRDGAVVAATVACGSAQHLPISPGSG